MKSLYIIVALFLFGINRSNAQAPGWQWAKSAGVVFQNNQSMCTDLHGNAYVTGSFSGATITFGNHTLTNNSITGGSNIFMVKYDTTGNVVWAQSMGGITNDVAQCITIDGLGNIYVSGYYTSQTFVVGTDTFINGLPGSATDFFLAKFDGNGNFYWATNKGLATDATYQNICVDANGYVYTTGSFGEIYTVFGDDTLRNSHLPSYTTSIYVAKYNLTGGVAWAKVVPGTSPNGIDYGQSVTADAFGNVYVSGYVISDTICFGHDTLIGGGFVLLKYTASGAPAWAKKAGGSAYNISTQGISTDASGNVYVTGNFAGGTMVFGTTTLLNLHASAGSTEIFLAKYDSTGNVIWARGAGGTGFNISNGVSIDAAGNSYIAGSFGSNGSSSITFENETLNAGSNSGGSVFVVQYGPAGNVVWAKSAGGNPYTATYATGVSANTFGQVYVTGYFSGTGVSFGNFSVSDTDGVNTNFFIARLGYHPDATGIDEEANAFNNIKIYPNPSAGNFYFAGIASGSTIQIYNVLGEMVYTAIAENNNAAVNLNGKAKGVYFYCISNNSNPARQGKIVLE